MQPNHQSIELSTLDRVIDYSFVTVASDISVIEAISLLNQTLSSCVLVVEELQLVGIFTEQDVVKLVASEANLPKLKLAEVMTGEVVTLTPSRATNAIAAFSLMSQHQIRHLPIVDPRGQLLGLVTQSSLLQELAPKATGNATGTLPPRRPDSTQAQIELESYKAYRPSILRQINRELQTTLEELQVSEEEVRQQNEELETARETLELEHQRYQDLFEFAPDADLVTDIRDNIQQANKAAASLLGVSQKMLVGKPLIVFVAKQDRSSFHVRLTNLQQVENWELYLQPRKGLPFLASIKLAPMYNLQNQHIGWRWLIRDITRQKQAEVSLQESEARFHTMADTAPVLVWVAGTDKLCNYFNKPWLEFTGRTLEQEIGNSWAQGVHPEDFQRCLDTYFTAFDARQPFTMEYRLRRFDGEYRWLLDTGNPRFNSDGSFAGYIGSCIDISDRKQIEDKLRIGEEQLRLALDFSHTGSWDWQIDTDTVTWNENFDRLLGLVPGEVEASYQTWRDRVHPDDIERVEQALNHALATDSYYETEYRIIQPNGSIRYLAARGQGLYNESGQAVRMVGVLFDISEQQAALRERKQAEQKIVEQAMLLDVATDAIFVRGLDSQILFWNQGAERLYGWSSAEALGKNANELLYRKITPPLQEALKTVFESGSWQGELSKIDKFGKAIVVASRWTLVRDEQGEPKSILTVDTDITEQKQLETQFLRVQRLESIGTLAGGIAHDLNNVLAPILMSVQLLLIKYPEDQNQRLLKMLENNVKRGAALIKQVLSFARGLEGDRTIVQVKHLILEIANIVKETFPKSIELYTDVAANLETVSADATQLHQVLMNLVVNARDAMPKGGILTISAANVEIDRSYAQMSIEAKIGRYIVITVADRGIGMSPEIIERIFDPFFTTKEIDKGTGLGLSTTLGIIKNHNGFLEVCSEVGKGSRFKVYLPASEEITTQLRQDPELLTGHGELILVVDDEAAICEIAKTSLETYGYRVLTANNGIEALTLYAQNKNEISLVLLDMMMPKMDGIVAVRTLQKMNPHISIVGMSGLTSMEAIAQGTGTGIQGFLSKPFTAQELLETLSNVLLEKRSRDRFFGQTLPD